MSLNRGRAKLASTCKRLIFRHSIATWFVGITILITFIVSAFAPLRHDFLTLRTLLILLVTVVGSILIGWFSYQKKDLKEMLESAPGQSQEALESDMKWCAVSKSTLEVMFVIYLLVSVFAAIVIVRMI